MKPSLEEFMNLVTKSNEYLNKSAHNNESYFIGRNSIQIEDDVLNALNECSIGTSFEGKVVKISGQRFPDIVVAQFYGVEVKSSHNNQWITLGGSVNESTRVEGVERVWVTFAKLVPPVAFVSRPYEECLSEVVVTHYPRYKINMTLENGDTIFDKMGTTYDELNALESPVRKIVDFYKSQLNEGESLWWIDTGSSSDSELANGSSIKVAQWKSLPSENQKEIICKGFVYFPKLLSNLPDKYEEFALWLVSYYGVVSSSLRDIFSAGGTVKITLGCKSYEGTPQIYKKIQDYKIEIMQYILAAYESELKEYWRVDKIAENRIEQWISLASQNCSLGKDKGKELLDSIFFSSANN
jgi:hypothetical protein